MGLYQIFAENALETSTSSGALGAFMMCLFHLTIRCGILASDPVCIKRERFQAKTIDTFLFEMKAFFDSYAWSRSSVTDTGEWIIEVDGQEANLLGLVDFERATGSVCCIGSAVSTLIRTVL